MGMNCYFYTWPYRIKNYSFLIWNWKGRELFQLWLVYWGVGLMISRELYIPTPITKEQRDIMVRIGDRLWTK